MAGKRENKDSTQTTELGVTGQAKPKYSKPRIMLIDMPPACGDALDVAGYSVAYGTFGVPLLVEPSDEMVVVPANCSLRGYQEQEIVFIDTAASEPNALHSEEAKSGVPSWWQECTFGVIDTRLPAMLAVRSDFDRILQHGGVFVVFASAGREIDFGFGAKRHGYVKYESRQTLSCWSFLRHFDRLNVKSEDGDEITFVPDLEISHLLKRGAAGSRYACTLVVPREWKDIWVPIAVNKYGAEVAGVLMLQGTPPRFVLVLPRMPAFHEIVVELLETFIAKFAPHLFPDSEAQSWVHLPEYEVPQVVSLLQSASEIEEAAKREVERIHQEVESVREANADWYTLLRGTGDELVGAVLRSLRALGFKKVHDMDELAKATGGDPMLREDIQVHDRSPMLVIDVKGLRGCPDDSDAIQSHKHAYMRMRELNRPDVQPLTIINHQRGLPPLERDPHVYRTEIVGNAENIRLGLMTTWDLFNILRNKDSLGWPESNVADIFYRIGRIDPVPSHYTPVGVILRAWDVAIRLEPTCELTVGSVLAIRHGVSFTEVPVSSLRVKGVEVQAARPGDDTSVGCANKPMLFRERHLVYLVQK